MTTKQEIEKVSGVYKIINKVNNKYYIGSSNNIHKRWNEHKRTLNENKHHSQYLQRSWNKYGPESFDFLIIESNINEKDLLIKEQEYLNKVNKIECFNSSYIAGKIEMNELTRKKISISNTGKKLSEETKQKLRLFNLGKKLSEETKQKIGDIHRGNKAPWRDKNIYEFYNKITNEKFEGTRINFYTKYNLDRRHVNNVIHKKEKSVRGWILEERMNDFHGKCDKTIYTFKNINTEELFIGIRFDFYTKYNLIRSNVDHIIKGRRKSHRGWILVQ